MTTVRNRGCVGRAGRTGGVPDRSDVVIALDGSHSRDCTALLVGTVAAEPHFDVLKVWANPETRAGGWTCWP